MNFVTTAMTAPHHDRSARLILPLADYSRIGGIHPIHIQRDTQPVYDRLPTQRKSNHSSELLQECEQISMYVREWLHSLTSHCLK